MTSHPGTDPDSSLFPGTDAPAFALLYRSGAAAGPPSLEILTGEPIKAAVLADLPVPAPAGATPVSKSPDKSLGPAAVLAVVPYRQIAERGFIAPADGAELLAMAVTGRRSMPLADALQMLPAGPVTVDEFGFDIADEDFAAQVRQVVEDEIGRGEGSNFVVKRTFLACIRDHAPAKECALFRRLLMQESGAYWTFLVHIGGLTFLGASPERHVTVAGGVAAMNPISGTYVYPPSGPDLGALLAFLADRKETDELVMVLEEELKMMAEVCAGGGRAAGPALKEMGHLAHTEYFIEGPTDLDTREVLRRTLVSPAVTGSPLESATRVIRRREPHGRGYYGGVVALFGTDPDGEPELDSAILIRTAQIDRSGLLKLSVGATVVRHSDPAAEAAETSAKAAAMLRTLAGPAAAGGVQPAPHGAGLAADPRVRDVLRRRNTALAGFWLAEPDAWTAGLASAPLLLPGGHRHRVLVIDAEDTFTAMLAHQIRALGPQVTVRRHDAAPDSDRFDLTVVGPGPGDPRRFEDPKMARLSARISTLLAERRPFVAVCLGHQLLCRRLGLAVEAKPVPNQGCQHEIDFFGRRIRAGFYNSFAAVSDVEEFTMPGSAEPVAVSRDRRTGEVHGLCAPTFRSFQFHPESVLSPDGLGILAEALTALLPLDRPATPADHAPWETVNR